MAMGAAKSGQLKRSLIGQRSPPVQLTFSRCRQLRYPRQLAISNLAQGSSLFLFQPPPDTLLAATRHSSECNHIHNECTSPLILSPVPSSRTSILYPSVAPGRQKYQLLTQNLQFQPLNPRPFLQARVGTEVLIRLKWGQTEYKGTLESIDSYMNVLLRDTEEFIDGKPTGALGLVLIRCNNILWMGSADAVEMTDMELK
ncbi:unnamed protein product [Penicillium bialowiezense]